MTIQLCATLALAATLFARTPAAAADDAPPKAAAATPAAPLTDAAQIAAARAAAEAAGITVQDLKVGKGTPAADGALVRVHYTGWLQDPAAAEGKGKKFDSSLDRKEPFYFQLGRRSVIRGWDLGVAGMQAGGRRRLVIPPAAGYGDRGAGGVIPPNATLVFDVELLDSLPPR